MTTTATAQSPTPTDPIDNVRVRSTLRLASPSEIKAEFPISAAARQTVAESRQTIDDILCRRDSRLLTVVGPCSIHDPKGALDYAHRLVELKKKTEDKLFLVMRVYFEKPRTTIGWKGLINDPRMDSSFDVDSGLKEARRLLQSINELGLPAATEFLDPIVPQYISDLITWAAIGARTTESQTHRQMASGLSMPVGFKNGTDGSIQTALDAMKATGTPHSFLGIDDEGFTSVITTEGNRDAHLVLRGGRSGPNFQPDSVAEVVTKAQSAGIENPPIMIDCSHANSGKIPARQKDVWNSILKQRQQDDCCIIGAMLESYIHEGSQKLPPAPESLKYGISVTDACLSWEDTETLLQSS